MKKFESLGQLLVAYRKFSGLSQSDLGAHLNVDNRTIIRWEKNVTLLKADKEEELADFTFIPYQVIRNLNAPIAIPTFYDFSLRKYATHEAFSAIPHADWLRTLPPVSTQRFNPIKTVKEIELIKRCLQLQGKNTKRINNEVLFKAAELFPELNFVLFENTGFYAGHCLILPLKKEVYQKIKSQTMHPLEIQPHDLMNPTKHEVVYFGMDFNADSNENLFHLTAPIRAYFTQKTSPSVYAAYTSRPDTKLLNQQFGIQLIWEHQHEWDHAPVKLFERTFG